SSPAPRHPGPGHSTRADPPASRNFSGPTDPAIDTLVEKLIAADSREELITRTRALDRLLLWGHYVVPNWHIKSWRVAYWNHLAHPTTTPRNDIGLMTWWHKPDTAAPAKPDEESLKSEAADAAPVEAEHQE